MRIIAGEARGLPLTQPPTGVRPTMDRVRGAIFSSLGDAVPGARVLDLFAGSGAMGIEALSRGAASATFVDFSPQCSACVTTNLRRAKLQGIVQTMDAMKFVELYATDGFDLIFADPPYAKRENDRNFAAELLAMPALIQALSPHGTLILEYAKGAPAVEVCVLSLMRVRSYSESQVAYYTLPK